ncbi:hypothetical protein [Qipengyuania sp. MTN3-11]|uniref:hypothetical protein n=1 Tax=Qipengyuania sp. MTN3-11 TaxID=3056557 RepID=UPI0036F2BA71
MHQRAIAVVALAIPVVAGIGYLFAFDAPPSYPAVNAGALVLATLWILFAPRSLPPVARRILLVVALAALFLPILTGPSISGVARWLPLGPVSLHAGMLCVPALAVMAADDPDHAPAILSIALFAAVLQPDMATGAAIMLATAGLYDATRDWKLGIVAIVAFFASLVAAVNGELAAQPFVEHVIFRLALTDPLAALGLLGALVASLLLILHGFPGREGARKALAGSLFGFSFAGLVSNYPSALVGYGAAPILGFGIGLGLMLGLRSHPAVTD